MPWLRLAAAAPAAAAPAAAPAAAAAAAPPAAAAPVARGAPLSEEAVAAFLGRQAAGLRDELGVLGGLGAASRQLAALREAEEQRIDLAMQQAERVAELHAAWAHAQRERERLHDAQIRASAVVGAWVAAHGPQLRSLLGALDAPELVKMLPLCAACCTQLPDDADAAKVRKAYLLTIRRIHPDKLAGQPKVRERAAASAIFDALRAAHDGG